MAGDPRVCTTPSGSRRLTFRRLLAGDALTALQARPGASAGRPFAERLNLALRHAEL